MSSLTKEQVLLEYVKCQKDTPYAFRTYLQTYDNTVSQYVPLELFPDQISLLEDYETHNENIALKYRQAGVSTVTAAWASKRIVFAKKILSGSPEGQKFIKDMVNDIISDLKKRALEDTLGSYEDDYGDDDGLDDFLGGLGISRPK